MDPLMKTIAIAEMELESDGNNNNLNPSEELLETQAISKQKRRLLDIAWKMYDITSEIFYLKSDVASLISKVDSLEAPGVKDEESVKEDGMSSKEDSSPSREVEKAGIRELFNRRKMQNYDEKKEGTILGMDDLSLSMFRDIVSEIAAESVGKIIAEDYGLDKQRLKSRREIGKKYESSKEREKDLRGDKEDKPVSWEYGSGSKTYLKKAMEERCVDKRYYKDDREDGIGGSAVKYDLFGFSNHRERGLEDAKASPLTMKKRVSFRRYDSNIDDEPALEDALFSGLNDSLYFHRSHLSPVQNGRYKLRHSNSSGKMSPVVSSDGSNSL